MTITNLPLVDRIPPQNLEAEMALLGSILVDREIMGIVNATRYIKMGARMILSGSDHNYLLAGAKARSELLRKAL